MTLEEKILDLQNYYSILWVNKEKEFIIVKGSIKHAGEALTYFRLYCRTTDDWDSIEISEDQVAQTMLENR